MMSIACSSFTSAALGRCASSRISPSRARVSPVSAEKPETITLSIDGQERLFWNDAPVPDAAALRERLTEAARRTPQPELHLRADQQVRYQRIAEVMSAAQQAGVTRLGFVTDPRAGAAPAAAAKGAPAK
jgi:biopolymer transport protein ExbD